MANDFLSNLSNPVGQIIKKYLHDLLQERYYKHQDVVERISRSLVTKGDIENFGKFILEIYEAGFFKAVQDNKELWEKLGYETTIVPSPSKSPQQTIFNPKNQE